ncbi:MAG: pilus assembly protein N-terminal domain-containing protein [Cyanobacteria bacterium TGS_CYA1]|nr:pilus assembly protein N-terminal domain-containing protein [Cyanobacteria bacterium TGS_CYA1]
MNKPKMSLALSALVALSAASQSAQAKAPSSAIWQKMAGVNEAPAQAKNGKTAKKSVKSSRKAPAKVASASSSASALDQSHAMLFIPGFGKDKAAALSTDNAPAAALSIHPSLPANIDLAPAASSDSSYSEPQTSYGSQRTLSEIPASEEVSTLKAPDGILDGVKTANDISALPDNLLAQAETGDITATPIPPVVTGTVELEEFKPTNIIDVAVSKSRTFKMRNKIVRTSISDPGVVEPVVISENQLVLLGKSPGRATMVLWDDAGNSSAIDVRVTRDYTQLQSTLREIDPRIIVKTYSVGGSDRVVLLGDVDHPESVIRGFAASNVYMDDRGMNIQVANNRLINARIGEIGTGGGGAGGGGASGQLAQLNSVDTYTFFPNINNNVSLAQAITSDGGRVTSLIKIRKVPLIAMHVTFMEMNTSAARSLAMSMGIGFTGYGFSFGIGGSNAPNNGTYLSVRPGTFQRIQTFLPPVGPTGTVPFAGAASPVVFFNPTGLGNINAIGQPVLASAPPILAQQVLLGAPGGAGFGAGGLGNLFSAISNISPNGNFKLSFNPTVQGIIANNRARILAEPTIVCISGERASFLAGGEIPIVQTVATAGAPQLSITYEPFGMRINFIPVLMENGSLNIEISPEERILSNTFAFNFPGSATSISGFTTRKTQTMVEMKPGQELFLSGLITNNSGRELSKYPILGEVPVIGALYRSKAFNKNESELVVAIRPEIILPGTPGQLKLPEEIGRVEGPRDMNMFQVEPTVLDERHYTSGRAERHQKTSPTLPEGAPIPDNR